jgi:phosphomannomutase
LPFNRNGAKFFTKKGGLDKVDISDILKIAATKQFTPHAKGGSIEKFDFISEYSNILVGFIRTRVNNNLNFEKPLSGVKIVVDAGNGAGGFFAHKVLEPLGADITGSQFLNPDGRFLNHVPNPEDKDAMSSICNAVIKQKADLGIIFDTDVDRSAIVDKNGNPINRNALIALISSIILEEHPASYIVTDSITSEGLAKFINKNLNGKHHRFKRGYKNVINESIRLNAEGKPSWLAIETSGHAALKENHFLDDGAYLVAKLLVKMAQLRAEKKELTNLIDDLQTPEESEEFRLKIAHNNFAKYGQEVIDKLHKITEAVNGWQIEPNNHEGIRVKCLNDNEKGWFLLRLSLHDPVMPLNIESDIKGGVKNIASKLKGLMSEFKQLDLSVIK